ncbi:MAG: hypothetical protein MR598_07920 [Erysipelotrichaceae bacterium]|nr:hypothetical protein [Erysipelotrichaceae bacterium]
MKISGIASIEEAEWPEGVLPTEPVTPESGTGSQISSSFQSEYLTGNSVSSTAQAKFSSVTETYDTASSTYTINITKTATNGNSAKPTEIFNLNFQIKNISNVTWTSGEVTNTYTSNGNFLSDVVGIIDNTTIAPGEIATLNMSFSLIICGKNKGTLYNEEITYKINYLVNNEVRTTTVILKFISV